MLYYFMLRWTNATKDGWKDASIMHRFQLGVSYQTHTLVTWTATELNGKVLDQIHVLEVAW